MVDFIASEARAGLMGAGDKAKLNRLMTTSGSAPTVTHDASIGYFSGARWYVTPTGPEYFCTDATPGAAVWKQVASGGGGGGSTGANIPQVQGLTGGSY